MERNRMPHHCVVIGGGTGAPASIRALLSLDLPTKAVVAMADDGGSTGILREAIGATTPGDVRKCIAAFAQDPEDPLVRAFNSRFAFADNHTLGNLMLSTLEKTAGSFPAAITICENLIKVRGKVYPSTLNRVYLHAETVDGRMIEGQANACYADIPLSRVELRGEGPIQPYDLALEILREADFIVLGPGSLFTSIIPNLLVPGVVEAIRASKAPVVFVCSIADIQGETRGMRAVEHVQKLFDYGMEGCIDYMLIHSAQFRTLPGKEGLFAYDILEGVAHTDPLGEKYSPVAFAEDDLITLKSWGITPVVRDFALRSFVTWHDQEVLQEAFEEVMESCRLLLK